MVSLFDSFQENHRLLISITLSGIQDWYDLPGVPFVMYFTDAGEAIYGIYWHDKFGRWWSHGCVNVTFSVSKFLYE